jgi:porphobilinogen synthase
MGFPTQRARRLRRTATLRRLVAETRPSVDGLVLPLFVVPGSAVTRPIQSMPGVAQLSVDRTVEQCREIADLGIPAVILFGIPERKDAQGSAAWADDGVVPRAVAAIKRAVPKLVVVTDVCLCEYTDHGHCGVVRDGDFLNDPTLELLAK